MGNMGEIAERIGDQRAESYYQQASTAAPNNIFLLTLYADYLAANNKTEEAYKLLQDHTYDDAALIRVAILAKELDKPDAKKWQEEINTSFAAVRDRGTPVHQREEALYFLELDPKPARAFELALENWNLQKEPLDALILARAARAAGKQGQLKELAKWQQQNSFQDVRLDALLKGDAQ